MQSLCLLSPLLGPMLLLKAVTSLLVLPSVSFMLTSRLLMVSQHASLTISTTTKPNDCRSSLADCTDGMQSLTGTDIVTQDVPSASASRHRRLCNTSASINCKTYFVLNLSALMASIHDWHAVALSMQYKYKHKTGGLKSQENLPIGCTLQDDNLAQTLS